MSERLTDEQLRQMKLDACTGVPPRFAHVIAAVHEICDRRITDLTAEDREALEWARGRIVTEQDARKKLPFGLVREHMRKADLTIAALSRLLGGAGRGE